MLAEPLGQHTVQHVLLSPQRRHLRGDGLHDVAGARVGLVVVAGQLAGDLGAAQASMSGIAPCRAATQLNTRFSRMNG